MRVWVARVLALMVLMGPASARDEVRDWPPAGIVMMKPDGWHDLTHEDMKRTFDKGTSSIPQKHEGPPVAVINVAKFKEPHPDLNPSVNVTLYPPDVAQVPIQDVIRGIEESASPIIADMKLIAGPHAVVVGGRLAAHLKFRHTFTLTTMRVAAIYEVWSVPLPHMVVVVAGSYREDEANGGSADIQRILQSVTFTDK